MTMQPTSDILELIAQRRTELGALLNIDPEGIADFTPPEDGTPYPALDDAQLNDLRTGGGRELLAKTIDHTILKAEATPDQVANLCDEARRFQFAAVCVNGAYVEQAATALSGSDIPVAAVVGFPLGMMATDAKAHEAKLAAAYGAKEIDMVINVGWLKAGRYADVFGDILDVVKAAAVPVKVIIETALLSTQEKIDACILARFAGAAFVKTSTGFSTGGATAADVALLRAVVGCGCGVKASGGIKDKKDAIAMLMAGANRLGASSGVAIMGG